MNEFLLQVKCHYFFLTVVALARVLEGWGTHRWQAAQTDMIVMGSVSMKKIGYQDPAPASNLVDQPRYLHSVQASSHYQIKNFLYISFFQHHSLIQLMFLQFEILRKLFSKLTLEHFLVLWVQPRPKVKKLNVQSQLTRKKVVGYKVLCVKHSIIRFKPRT